MDTDAHMRNVRDSLNINNNNNIFPKGTEKRLMNVRTRIRHRRARARSLYALARYESVLTTHSPCIIAVAAAAAASIRTDDSKRTLRTQKAPGPGSRACALLYYTCTHINALRCGPSACARLYELIACTALSLEPSTTQHTTHTTKHSSSSSYVCMYVCVCVCVRVALKQFERTTFAHSTPHFLYSATYRMYRVNIHMCVHRVYH